MSDFQVEYNSVLFDSECFARRVTSMGTSTFQVVFEKYSDSTHNRNDRCKLVETLRRPWGPLYCVVWVVATFSQNQVLN